MCEAHSNRLRKPDFISLLSYFNSANTVNLDLFYFIYSMEAEMNPKVIVIDGKTYNNINEMPPDVRQKYEQAMRTLGDADNNRVPDVFEGANLFADQDRDGIPDAFENLPSQNTAVSSMKIMMDGKEFHRIEDLPPDARARYEEAMGKMDANRNGIPDFVEGMFSASTPTTQVSSGHATPEPDRTIPLPASPTITPDTSSGLMLVLTGLFIFFLCVAGAGAVWYFFLR